jgi:hypothetical protein
MTNHEKTQSWYRNEAGKDLCQCESCKNYYRNIRRTYPDLSAYLSSLGIDIEKPLETWSVEQEDGKLLYPEAMYVIIGSSDSFQPFAVGNIAAEKEESFPSADIKDEYFVISLHGIVLEKN